MTGVQQTGERVEALIAALRGSADPAAAGAAEELVGLLVGLYGDGLSAIMAVLAANGEAGAAIMTALTEDPLVTSLLLLHDLHPLNVDERIQQALDRVRPYLGSHAGGVQYLGVRDGVARLRLEGSCHGCPSSTVTVRLAIEGAVQDAAPEVSRGRGGGDDRAAAAWPHAAADRPAPPARAGPGTEAGWVTLPSLGPPSSRPVTASADGVHGPGLLGARHAVRLPGRLRRLRFLARRREAGPGGTDLPGLRGGLQRPAGREVPGRRPGPAP